MFFGCSVSKAKPYIFTSKDPKTLHLSNACLNKESKKGEVTWLLLSSESN